jgi:peptidyl-prolyl cis-trans isomerase D
MAVIGKIREKSSLLLIVIGVAMLAFILSDLMSSGNSMFGGDQNVGEIAGQEISGVEFENRVNEALREYEINNQTTASSVVKEQIREQVWNELITELILDKELEKLGVTVSPDELFDMVQGPDPHPQVKQAFSNPQTGEFNPAQVINFLKQKDNDPTTQAQWLLFEKAIEKERKINKYNTLISKGLYATTSMAKKNFIEQNRKMNLDFVAKRYIKVHDSTITVTEEEMQAYYEAHKYEYEQEEGREIEYVRFDVIPTKEDTLEAKKWIEDIADDFKKSEDDSLFVSLNSDEPFDPTFKARKDLPLALDTTLFDAEIGTMVGPVLVGNKFFLAKLTKTKMIPDSVKARHILIKTPNPNQLDSTGYFKLDSIRNLVKKGADFAKIAKEVSEDVGSAIEGGDLGWFTEGVMVPPFNNACFNGNVGDMPIVLSQFGWHLIKIEDQAAKSKRVQIARLARNIEPSSDTYDKVFAEATSFYANNNSPEAFEKATEKEYTKRLAEIRPNDKGIAGLENPRELIVWAFNNEEGAISEPFQFDNVFVVAHVSKVKEEGYAPLEQVKIQVEIGAKKEKKAAMFIKEMEGETDLNKLAEKLKTTVETATGVTFAAYSIPNMGREPEVLGMVSTLKEGQVSIPIKGNTGVYVVKMNKIFEAPDVKDYSANKTSLESAVSARVSMDVFEALKKRFGVKDERYKFY